MPRPSCGGRLSPIKATTSPEAGSCQFSTAEVLSTDRGADFRGFPLSEAQPPEGVQQLRLRPKS